jgi:hypothetical protein
MLPGRVNHPKNNADCFCFSSNLDFLIGVDASFFMVDVGSWGGAGQKFEKCKVKKKTTTAVKGAARTWGSGPKASAD